MWENEIYDTLRENENSRFWKVCYFVCWLKYTELFLDSWDFDPDLPYM
jgi:hypothetical protein